MTKTDTINTGDLKVFYLEKSDPAPLITIIFIHGFPFSSEIWKEQLEELPDGVRGIAYDIRGFGKSRGGHSFFSVDLFAQDLIKFISALSLTDVVLCGISMGGYIALRAVEIGQKFIKGLVLCDTNSEADSNEGKLKRFDTIEQVVGSGSASFAENFVPRLFSEKTLSHQPSLAAFITQMIAQTLPQTICSAQLALASRTDTTAALSLIDFPVLVIRGAEDKLMTQEQAALLIDKISDSELVTVPHSGHLPNLENPVVFNEALRGFLNKHFLS